MLMKQGSMVKAYAELCAYFEVVLFGMGPEARFQLTCSLYSPTYGGVIISTCTRIPSHSDKVSTGRQLSVSFLPRSAKQDQTRPKRVTPLVVLAKEPSWQMAIPNPKMKLSPKRHMQSADSNGVA